MKKTAPKKEKVELSEENNDDLKTIDETASNTSESLDNKGEVIHLEKESEPEPDQKEPTFYEKVTGEDPTRQTFITDDEAASKLDNVNSKLFFLGGFVFLLTVVIATLIGFVILNYSKPDQKAKQEVIEEVQPTPTPTPLLVKKEDWTFEILNGSGVKGAAADAQEKIEALGYTVESIGNADENVGETEVYLKEGVNKNEAEIVLKDLEDDFGKLTIEDSDSDSDSEILIILGEN